MKKGKVLGKGQIAVFVMVLALAASVWLNVKYSGNTKYLGDVTYVSNKNKKAETVETSAKVKESSSDYFEEALKEREESYEKAEEAVKDALKSANLTEGEKQKSTETLNKLSNRIASEQNIESLLKAKGFKKALAILNDSSANIVVSGSELSNEQTLKIQDIVTNETDIPVSKIKIVTVK